MNKNIFNILQLLLSIIFASVFCIEFNGITALVLLYLCGFIGGMSIVLIKLNTKNSKLNMYKRELEKEAICSDENSAKVKVLEAKIEVLEKALNNALNK